MKIIFAGTPDFAAEALRALVESGHEVVLVLSQPDRPRGRGMKLSPSPVKALALEKGISVLTPETLSLRRAPERSAAIHAGLKRLGADLLVVAAYGLILPEPVLNAARGIGLRGDIRALNIHASLLPRWRGAAPIARAIEAGDPETGVTLMKMELGLDTGPMIARCATPILSEDTTESLTKRLAGLGSGLLVEALRRPGLMDWTPQPEEGVTYAEKLLKTEGRIDWSEDAQTLARRLRAFTPFPGLFFEKDGLRIKVSGARARENSALVPAGTVLEARGRLAVRCGRGALELTELQKPGRPRMPAASFLQSLPLEPGERLS